MVALLYNNKYVLRHSYSYFAADRAFPVIRQFVADAVHPLDAACDGWDSSSCSGQTMGSCGTGGY